MEERKKKIPQKWIFGWNLENENDVKVRKSDKLWVFIKGGRIFLLFIYTIFIIYSQPWYQIENVFKYTRG